MIKLARLKLVQTMDNMQASRTFSISLEVLEEMPKEEVVKASTLKIFLERCLEEVSVKDTNPIIFSQNTFHIMSRSLSISQSMESQR